MNNDARDILNIPTLRSFENVDHALLQIAECESELTIAEANMNERIQAIRDEYERNTSVTRAMRDAIVAEVKKFCLLNKGEFEKTRSKSLTHGIVGFRTNPPKVVALSRRFTWKTIVELLKRIYGETYIRTKIEPDKEAILADYAQRKIKDDQLAGVGIRIEQDEEFYYDIKWEEIEIA